MIRVARVDEDLVVLFEPGVELVPVEGDVVGQGGLLGARLGVAPGCPLGDALADTQRPVVDGRRGFGVVTGGLQQVGVHVRAGEPVDGHALRLEHQHDPRAVGDRDATEEGPHPARARLDREGAHEAWCLRREGSQRRSPGRLSHRCRHGCDSLPSRRTAAAAVQNDLPQTRGRQTGGLRRRGERYRRKESATAERRALPPNGRPYAVVGPTSFQPVCQTQLLRICSEILSSARASSARASSRGPASMG